MGVYNAEGTIEAAIDSIVNQTYENWEFVICDDASTDDTYNILLEYKKKFPNKFVLLQNKENSKLSYSLNKCLKNANGYYIARMDADDISKNDRLEKQINFLKDNQNIDLVGTAMQRFKGAELNDFVNSVDTPDKYTLRYKTPFNHATIMTYKSVYKKLKGYTVSELTSRSQDVDLWFRFFFNGFKGANLKEALYFVREDEKAIKRRTPQVRINSYKIKVRGYKLLEYPLHWYVKLTLDLIIKLITPYKLIQFYRRFQAKFK